MKDLVKQYLDSGISRRTLMKRLSAVGVGAVAAKTMAKALAPATARAADAAPGAMRAVTGNGGRLFTPAAQRSPASNSSSAIPRPATAPFTTRWSTSPRSS